MINAELSHVKTLEEFYKEIRGQQEAAHGKDYCQQHDAIRRLLKTCSSYKELGTHQGGTAAGALLMKPKRAELVDISMEKYRKFAKPIFESFCKDNDISLSILETDSTGPASVTSEFEVMLIDSRHARSHMELELKAHASKITNYIVFHDTTAVPELYDGISYFCRTNPWKVVERGFTNVGYTVIERV